MPSELKMLGVLRPRSGGDPIQLRKQELTIGRRPNCDIRLDHGNVSGRHCLLRWERGTWHVYDLGSSNGTTVNGLRVITSRGVMPEDLLGIAGHLFAIDYEMAGGAELTKSLLEDQFAEPGLRNSSSIFTMLPASALEATAPRPAGAPRLAPPPKAGGNRRTIRVDDPHGSVLRIERAFRAWEDLPSWKKVAALVLLVSLASFAYAFRPGALFRESVAARSRRAALAAVGGQEEELRAIAAPKTYDDALRWIRLDGPALRRRLKGAAAPAVEVVSETERDALVQLDAAPGTPRETGGPSDPDAPRYVYLQWEKGPRGEWLLDGSATLRASMGRRARPAQQDEP